MVVYEILLAVSSRDRQPAGEALESHEWVVGDVRGRRSSPEKGLATVDSMTLRRPDGSSFVMGRIDRGGQAVDLDVVMIADQIQFDRCPICLAPGPTTDEHVPPEQLGGSVMTATCNRCNNQLGSVVESDLLDWWEDALVAVRLSHADVTGARRAPRILVRQKDSGEPVLVFDRGRVDPEIRGQIKPGGEFTMAYSAPSEDRYRIAALKSAYLASCVLLRTIPTTPEADAVRAELMRVRDLPRRSRIERGPVAAALQLARSNGPAAPGEIALVRVNSTERSEPEFAVSLARTLLVSWPVGGYFVMVGPDGPMPAIRVRGWGMA